MPSDEEFRQLVADYKSAQASGDPEALKVATEAISTVLKSVVKPQRPEPFYDNTVVEISVPSGKLILDDSLRSVAKYDLEATESINYGRGCDAFAKLHAEKCNLAYAQVGNTCPSITVNAAGLIQIVSPAYDEDGDIAIFEDGEVYAGYICTDLWAVMAVDYQEWLDNGGKPVEEADFATVLDVKPGRYRWTVFSHSDSFDSWEAGRHVYAQLELI